jgi:prepilin-type N-terminal cleavage/methylation domain-containing protein
MMILLVPPKRWHSGFSLLEMAVVMVIVGLLLGGLFSAIGDSTQTKRRSDATAQINLVEEALYGFAQANGRLPCPATIASVGQEAPVGGGACTAAHGFVPALALGLQGSINTQSLLLDPWGSPLRYSVADLSVTGDRAFTSAAGIAKLFGNTALMVPGANMLCVSSTTACGATVQSNIVPALIYSLGADWSDFASVLEVENVTPAVISPGWGNVANNNFVSTTYSDEGANQFDDILVWLSPNILFSRLVTAGQLP